MNIALLGPSGAGKGTHSRELCLRFDMEPLSTGDLLRENLRKGTWLGQIARRYMDAGELVPDEGVDGIIAQGLHGLAATNILLDGFPRRGEQAEFLEHIMNREGQELDGVIYLHVPENEIVRRLTGRLICSRCHEPYHKTDRPPEISGVCDTCGGAVTRRPDETAETALKRYRVFKRHIGPALEFYQRHGKLQIVDASRPIAVVRDDLILAVEAVYIGATTPATAQEPAAALQQCELRPIPKNRGLNLVLLGAPGSGKGTQAERLAAEFSLPHIASGDLFRDNLKRGTRLGQMARTFMDRGELVPDDITEAMVEERLAEPDTAEGFILDGFPRTDAQATALAETLRHHHRSLGAATYIRVADEQLVERLSGRFICSSCQAPFHARFNPTRKPGACDKCGGVLLQRDDDKPAIVRARLKTFAKQTEPLIDRYRREGRLIEVDGNGDIATIYGRIAAAISGLAEPTPRAGGWEVEIESCDAALT